MDVWQSWAVCPRSLPVLSGKRMGTNGHVISSLKCVLKNANSKIHSLNNVFIVQITLKNVTHYVPLESHREPCVLKALKSSAIKSCLSYYQANKKYITVFMVLKRIY